MTSVKINYPHWTAEADKTALHCPFCSTRGLYKLNVGDDDTILHMCVACEQQFYMGSAESFSVLARDMCTALVARALGDSIGEGEK